MRRVYLVQSQAPLVSVPDAVIVLGYSVQVGAVSWLTLVSVPFDSRWDNYKVMETFAYEGCYASQFVSFGQV